MTIDYRSMKVGDRVAMPVPHVWEGTNQDLYREIQEYCQITSPAPQFEVETTRQGQVEFWLQRTR